MHQIPELERAPSVTVVDENVIMPVERALGVNLRLQFRLFCQ